jgi:hypothetical protein
VFYECIVQSLLFKDIKNRNPEIAAKLDSELEAIVNMGDVGKPGKDIEDSNTMKDAQKQ